jgi:formylglycine-generating enzyme required for sulfatase activity
MTAAVAIDFGTSRTKLAYLDSRSGRAELMRLGLYDQPFMPSLFYLERDGERILMGDDAEEMLGEDPAGVVDLLKRKLHDTFVRANRRRVPTAELLGTLLGYLADRAYSEVPALRGKQSGTVYLTVPAAYGPAQERVLREAAGRGGLDEIALVSEPVAAARAWLAETGDTDGDVVVLDCGGGIVDWAYLRRDSEDFKLIAECPPGGDSVGGHDVDRELLHRVNELLGWSAEDELRARKLHYLRAVRTLKERFCRGLPLIPLRVARREANLTADIIHGVIAERFVVHICEGLNGYLADVRAAGGPEKPLVLFVGGSARLKGLREVVEKECGCQTAWWERSEYATVLGALSVPVPETRPERHSEVLESSSLSPPVAAKVEIAAEGTGRTQLPSPEDMHGKPATFVQQRQRETALALSLPILFRDRLHSGGEGPEMVVIPPGRFFMGSPAGELERDSNEGPPHEVTLARPVAIGRHVVTFAEYDAYCAATRCKKPGDNGWGRGQRPVINVSWKDATAYAVWLSEQTGQDYRLPTEAEWEYACRAGTTTPFWWGNTITPNQANYDSAYSYGDGPTAESRKQTLAVCTFGPNPWGLYQMHGNVRELVQDYWHDDYTDAPQDGSVWGGSAEDDADFRVARGGGWGSGPKFLRSAKRVYFNKNTATYVTGFRIAKTL